MSVQGPAKAPCGSCPYRKDVPPGVWHDDEYAKLPAYDGETFNQPPAMFMCHQQNDRLCAGWVGCHEMSQSLALRLGLRHLNSDIVDDIFNYVSPVPLWSSGKQAAEHGMQPKNDKAERIVQKLLSRRDDPILDEE